MAKETSDPSDPSRAFADLSEWRKIAVAGDGVLGWLGRLLDADLSQVAPGRACHAYARPVEGEQSVHVTVTAPGGSLMVVQDPDSTPSVVPLLSAHAAGSDISLEDRTADLALFAFPARTIPPDVAGGAYSAPSCLGEGVDVFALAEDRRRILGSFSKRFRLLESEELRRWNRGRVVSD